MAGGALQTETQDHGAPARPSVRLRLLDQPAFVSLALFAIGLVFILALEVYGQGYARNGHYFQFHSSEDMMQTLSVIDLRDHPWQSLLVLHIQPPLLDALRALLAQLWPDVGRRALVLQVDRALYLIWAAAYAGITVLVFRWLRRLVASTRLAALAALAFLPHPAAIYYGSYLDSTTLTSLGVLALSYALWAMPRRSALVGLGCSYVFLFLLRSIFQWPALAVLLVALALMRVPRRRVAAFAAACGLLVGAYMMKQYLVFGSTSTSSFAGSSCLHSLGEEPEMGLSTRTTVALGPLLSQTSFDGYPSALTRDTKVTGAHNFNHVADLANERNLMGRCVEQLISQPIGKTFGAYSVNLAYFLQPSSRYYEQPHAIVDRLPWRDVYDWLLSGYRLVVLLALATAAWARGRSGVELARGLGLALPVLFVSFVCVVFERGENMRFKFFVEPVLYVFLVSQLAAMLRRRPRSTVPAARAS